MLKKTTHWLLLILLVGPIYLFAAPNNSTIAISSISIDDCPTLTSDLLYTSNLSNTYTYIYCPRNIGAIRTQFRYRPMGANDWHFSRITKTTYQFIINLEAGTDYEFQLRYECTNNSWSSFSDSGHFTTTGVKSMEDTDDESEEPIDSLTNIDTTFLQIVDAFASCGDTLLCAKIQSSNYDSLSTLQFAITWDINALQMISVETYENIMETTSWTAQDTMLANWGIFTYQQDSLPVSSATTNLFTLCFSPLSEGTSTVSFIDPTIDYVSLIDSLEIAIEANSEFVWLVDSLLTIDSSFILDSILQIDSIVIVDSLLTVDSIFALDSLLQIDSLLTCLLYTSPSPRDRG